MILLSSLIARPILTIDSVPSLESESARDLGQTRSPGVIQLAQGTLRNTTDDLLPERFLKPITDASTMAVIKEQMSHVENGCLSDPDPAIVSIHRQNPVTKEYFLGRGIACSLQ